ncbi:MAG TPA: hypothetical protein VIY98_09620 [Nitrososphaeraceae archaeon]
MQKRFRDAKKAGIRVKNNVKSDLQFIRGMIGIHPASSEGDVVETLIKMFKQKKIGQLIDGKNYKIPLDSDLVTFFNDRDAQKTIKEYEYLLNEKQSTLNNYIYLDTACELAKVDKVQVIEIVRNKKIESITNLLD